MYKTAISTWGDRVVWSWSPKWLKSQVQNLGRKLIPMWPLRFTCEDSGLSKRVVALGLVGSQYRVGTKVKKILQ